MKFYTIAIFLFFSIPTFGQDPETTPTPIQKSTVRGRVFYAESGRPVRRASVMLIADTMRGGPGESGALTDNEGNFEMKDVPAGTYYPMVNAPGVVSPMAFLDFSQMERPGASEKSAFQEAFKDFEKIIVNGVSDTYVQIAAKRGGAISGRVYYDDGDVAVGVRVEVLRKVGDKYLSVIPNFSAIVGMFGGGQYQSDDRGAFRFSGLPPGEYIVKATENVSHSDSSGRGGAFESTILGGGSSFLTVFNPDTLDPASAQPVKVEYGTEMTEVNVTIPSRYLFKLGGRVISRANKTPVKAEITLQRVGDEKLFSIFSEIGRRMQGAQTDPSGNWSFKELPKGKYKLVVTPRVDPVYNPDDFDEEGRPKPKPSPAKTEPRYSSRVQEVIVEDRDQLDLSIELGYGATVSGIVAVENLINEMPRSVSIRAEHETPELSTRASVTNYDVSAEVAVSSTSRLPRPTPQTLKPNHDFKIENVASGKTKFTIRVDDGDYYVKSAMAGSTDLLTTEYDFKEGEKLENVRIVLGKGVGTIKGVILTADKEPASGVRIILVPTDAKKRIDTFQRTVQSDTEGAFEAKVAPGEYAVIVVGAQQTTTGEEWKTWLAEHLEDATKVSVESGKTETVNLKVE